MILQSSFRPAWCLPGPHLQTLWPNLVRPRLRVSLERERLELPDGDFLDLDWTSTGQKPIILVLHGLGGSSHSQYARGILKAIHENGWRGVMMHFRGGSNEPNRLTRHYHGGDTHDLQTVFSILQEREPGTPIAVLGYSLGANILLKWLGETQEDELSRLPVCAIAVSVPFQLDRVAKKLDSGEAWLYQQVMLNRLKRMVKLKYKTRNSKLTRPFDLSPCLKAKSIFEFDDNYTAPLHGFKDADDYYKKSSCRSTLKNIRIPALILHSADDPFMIPDIIPVDDELAPDTILELSQSGGHVGFAQGHPWNISYWLEERIPRYLSGYVC